ncbi:MAG TPA: class I SAM-dependent methyltransferase [Chitinophagaceae bacterium]|jgi:23S rRNA (cytosine1962-C5)-methyltransferase|nr:class I SAM-dependent methyltransferase [Chitinophagaceae bacterium]
MTEDKFIMFRNRLEKVYRHLGKQAKRRAITCYRLYDHDLPEFPLCIEIYEQNIYMAEYKRRHGMNEDEHDEWISRSMIVICEVLKVSGENIFLKLRQKKPGRLGQYQKTAERRSEFVVEENKLKFIVNLSDYLDTGLFLDHRVTREKVRAEANNKKVLNLFSYTGSFSVYAASAEANEVVTVDLSKTYLDWAKRNMQLNRFIDLSRYKFIQADVLQYLDTVSENYFDIIILDPPTFSNSKRMENILDIQRDHVKLINDCLRILRPSGKIYFSTNYKKFVLEKASIQSSFMEDITKQTTPFDFDGRINRVCYLIEK